MPKHQKLKTLVVSPWGHPVRWRRARYLVEVPLDVGRPGKLASWGFMEGEGFESFSSSAAVARALRRLGFDVSVRVYVADSIVALPELKNELRTGLRGELYERALEVVRGLLELIESGSLSYREVLNAAGEVASTYLRGYLNDSLVSKSVDTQLRVLPGSGRFKSAFGPTFRFNSSPINFGVALELDLIREHLIEGLKGEVGPDLIVLDLSHGINFMPSLTLRAVSRFLEHYSAILGREVVLAVVNSDPVSEDGEEALIHLVSLSKFTPSGRVVESTVTQLLSRLGDIKPRFRGVSNVVAKKVSCELRECIKPLWPAVSELRNLLKYVRVGDVLDFSLKLIGLSTSGEPPLEEAVKTIGCIKEVLESEVRVSVSGGREGKQVEVSRDFTLGEDFPSVIYAYLVATKVLKDVGEALEKRGEEPEGLIREGELTYVSLKFLKEVALKQMKKLGISHHTEAIVEHEISDIQRKVREYLQQRKKDEIKEPIPYTEIYSTVTGTLEKELKEKCEIDKRNFYAHAGLERNSILIKHVKGETYTTRKPECIEEVNKRIKET